MEIVHSSIMGTSEALLEANLNDSWWEIFCNVVSTIIYAAAAIAALVFIGWTAVIPALVGTWYAKSLLSDAFSTDDNR